MPRYRGRVRRALYYYEDIDIKAASEDEAHDLLGEPPSEDSIKEALGDGALSHDETTVTQLEHLDE